MRVKLFYKYIIGIVIFIGIVTLIYFMFSNFNMFGIKQKDNNLENKEESKEDINDYFPKNEELNKDNSNNKEESKVDKLPNSNNNQGDNLENKPSSGNGKEENKPNVETPPSSQTPPPEVITQSKLNNEKRKEIESKYGISLKYGKEFEYQYIYGAIPNHLVDDNEITTMLNNVQKNLKRYPEGIFKEMKSYGMGITFYLIKSDPQGRYGGFVDQQVYTDIKFVLTLQNSYNSSKVFNHEMMHLMEAHMKVVSGGTVFSNWNNLLPLNFIYGGVDNTYVCNGSTGAYFINSYGKTSYLEDRATIFEDIMFRVYLQGSCYNDGEIIRKKAIYIFDELNYYFNSITDNTINNDWGLVLK